IMYHDNSLEALQKLPTITYRRKSGESDERQVLSLSTQEDICQDLIERYNLNHFIDYWEKKSAKVADNRPKFDDMMKLMIKRKGVVLVCWKVHRLARNLKEGGWLVDLLQNNIIRAIITQEKVYYPWDNTFVQIIELASANQYSRDVSNGVNVSFVRKAKLGIPFKTAPIGYLNNKHKPKGQRDWRDDPERMPLVQQVFKRLLSGKYSARAVWLYARNTLGLTSRKRGKYGGGPLSQNGFYNMIKRPEYAGFYFLKGERYQITGNNLTFPLKEEEYWRIRQMVRSRGVFRPQKPVATYSGFLNGADGHICVPDRKYHLVCDCKHKFSYPNRENCPKCGIKICKMVNPIYRHYVYYKDVRCANRWTGFSQSAVNEKKIDRFLMDYAQANFALTTPFAEWARRHIKELQQQEVQAFYTKQAAHKKMKQSLELKLKQAKDGYLEGVFSKVEYTETRNELYHKLSRLTSPKHSVNWLDALHKVIDLTQSFTKIIADGSISEKRDLLARMNSNLVWNG
ncbi:MAG: recombinase family protein, partial [Bacteroidota bacterium]